jgi:hypothetical protein
MIINGPWARSSLAELLTLDQPRLYAVLAGVPGGGDRAVRIAFIGLWFLSRVLDPKANRADS